MDILVKKAYENWIHVIEYDGKSLLGCNEDDSSDTCQAKLPMDLHTSSTSQQHILPTLSVPVPTEQPSMDSGLVVGGIKFPAFFKVIRVHIVLCPCLFLIMFSVFLGYDDSMAGRLTIESQNVHLNATIPFNGASFPLQNPLVNDNELVHSPSQSTVLGFNNVGISNIPKGVEDFFLEDKEMSSNNEMLENEDMQHLIHIFNMGNQGHIPFNASDDSHPYSSTYLPPTSVLNYGFDNETTSPSSGKAVVGWLKLKAALRWGIFTRKKAAERRAHLVELNDL